MKLALIGMMGAGKTAAAGKLAEKGYQTLDTDTILTERFGMSVQDIFSRYGENAFRKAERSVLHDALASDATVVACGGGVLKLTRNRSALKKSGRTVVYLRADASVLWARLTQKEQPVRPLLLDENGCPDRERLSAILRKRELQYQKMAHVIIDIHEDSTVESVSKQLEELMNLSYPR